jgi:hypothetical protein
MNFAPAGPLLGPLGQILRETVSSRLSSDLNFSEKVFQFLKTDIPNGVGQR